MEEIQVKAKEQEFPYNEYTISLKFNPYDGYWFYDIVSDEKAMYGIPLYIDDYVHSNLDYLEIPKLILVDSTPDSIYPIDIYNDLGQRLKLIVIDDSIEEE